MIPRFNLTEADREDIAERVAQKICAIYPKYLTAKEAAKVLNISLSRLYQIKDEIGYKKIGNEKQSHLRFRLCDVKKFL